MLAAILHQESWWTKTRNTLKEMCESNTGRAKEQQDTNDCSYRERITEISEDGIIVLYEETVIEWARDPVFVYGEWSWASRKLRFLEKRLWSWRNLDLYNWRRQRSAVDFKQWHPTSGVPT